MIKIFYIYKIVKKKSVFIFQHLFNKTKSMNKFPKYKNYFYKMNQNFNLKIS